MDLDLNKFRTLIPVNSLYEDALHQLVKQTIVERYYQGDVLFNIGDEDPDSIFLLSGEIRLTHAENYRSIITSTSDAARYALSNLRPRQFRADVISDTVTVARVDAQLLEKLLAWDQVTPEIQGYEVAELEGPSAEDSEWMMSMLQTSAFLKLPAANIQRLFERMEEIEASKGDEIVTMGDPGDYFYLIKQGRCSVTRPAGSSTSVLAELGPCDSFGEEALISNKPRNATVSMLTDGTLMRISKRDFLQLLEEPLLKKINPATAQSMMQEGAALIDVRLETEFRNSSLKGALNIPLYLLRLKAPLLEKNRKYIFYCDTGERSSAAAFLLKQKGYDVYVLRHKQEQ
jgi:CRP-like cAMP-binding protein